jgi:N-acyl-D-amino-acid deacylase
MEGEWTFILPEKSGEINNGPARFTSSGVFDILLTERDTEDIMIRTDRRTFLKSAAKAAVVLSGTGCGLLLKGCSSRKDFDLVIFGGTVYDGLGGAPFRADLGIRGGLIASIGEIPLSRAAKSVDANGLVVAPGFIDIHDHTAESLLVNPRAESAVRQGVTTLVSGNCGDSPFPLSEAMAESAREDLRKDYGLDHTWTDIRGFFGRLEESGTAVNYSTLLGHGTLREAVMGLGDRPPSAGELERMTALVRASMEGGALGLSTGLEYTPGSFASTEELIALARAASGFGGVYATHLRNEEEGVLEALAEAFRIAREAPVKLQVSHLKIGFARNWPKFGSLLGMMDEAVREGLDFRCDRYPYTAWATGLSLVFPLWSREGTTGDFVARLKDPDLRERFRAAIDEEERNLGSWSNTLISSVSKEKNKPFEGKSILEGSREAGLEPFEFIRTMLIDEGGAVGMITFGMSEEHLLRLYAHPLVGVGADGSAVAPYGPLAKGRPHPRLYGTFPRVLGKYVREEQVVPLEEMIRKMTAMPADHFGFRTRGRIVEGFAADVVVFDPDRITDKATWADPMRYPEGIPHVLVNGVPVVASGEHTGELPGKVLRKGAGGIVA